MEEFEEGRTEVGPQGEWSCESPKNSYVDIEFASRQGIPTSSNADAL